MVSTRTKKRKADDALEEDNAQAAAKIEEEAAELEPVFTRGDIWYEDGSVVLVAKGNAGFKVSCRIDFTQPAR